MHQWLQGGGTDTQWLQIAGCAWQNGKRTSPGVRETCYVDHRSEFLGEELWLVHTFQASVSSCRWAMQASCSNAQIVRFAIVY